MKWFWSAFAALLLAACNSGADDFTKRSKLGEFDLLMSPLTLCAEADRAAEQFWAYPESWRVEVATSACTLPVDDITPDSARSILGEEAIAFTTEGDVYTLYQRADAPEGPNACCSLQSVKWSKIDGDVFATRLRLRGLKSAMISQAAIVPGASIDNDAMQRFRGPIAPVKPQPRADLTGDIFDFDLYTPALGETRRILVYRPNWLPPDGGYATLILADGASLNYYARIIEPLIDAGEIEPVLIIGILSGRAGIVEERPELEGDVRAMDYIPAYVDGWEGPSRFEPHLNFVTEEVLPWAAAKFRATELRERTIVTGSSNGGVFALHAGVQRPDVFGHAWPMSAGIGFLKDAPKETKTERAAFRMSAGWYETGFVHGSGISANTLNQAGYDVDTKWYSAGHMTDQWELRLLDNLRAVFPKTAVEPIVED